MFFICFYNNILQNIYIETFRYLKTSFYVHEILQLLKNTGNEISNNKKNKNEIHELTSSFDIDLILKKILKMM